MQPSDQQIPNPLSTEHTNSQQPQSSRSSHLWLWLTVGILALIFAVMVVTCPKTEDHRDAVRKELTKSIHTHIDQDNTGVFGAFGKLLTSQISEMAVNNLLSVDNYVVYSVGRIEWQGDNKIVSFGLLGHVYTFDAEDLDEAYDKASNKTKSKKCDRSDEHSPSDATSSTTHETQCTDADTLSDNVEELLNDFDVESSVHEVKRAAQEAAKGAKSASKLLDRISTELDKMSN